MSAPESANSRPGRATRRVVSAGAAAVVLAAGVAAVVASQHPASRPAAAREHVRGSTRAQLTASSCSGPAGAAYVADAGWDGFSAINTANCDILQTYNVGDPSAPGFPGDTDYSSTDEAVAIHGNTLYFADAGDDNVGIIDTTQLNPSDYNPAGEIDVHVGFVPTSLTVSPDGQQVWVADSGPQTGPQAPSGISILSTATNKVTGHLRITGGPQQVAFSPDGSTAYVTTANGLDVINTAKLRVTTVIRGLGDPHAVAVSPDGRTVYVTNTQAGQVELISAASLRVTGSIKVGQLPWDIVLSADGGTMYVANPDSNSISVISTARKVVTNTLSVQGDPDTMSLTPDGSQLWVGTLTYCWLFVYSTATLSEAGAINLGAPYPNGADGYEPTGIVLTGTPSPGSDATAKAKLNVPALLQKS
jgi:YVTN family beta-propeller protein